MAKRIAPLLPLRDIIVFPHQVVPLFVGREKSISALREAARTDKELILAAQKQAKTNEPGPNDVFEVGTIGAIVQLLQMPDDTVKVIIEGRQRARVTSYASVDPHLLVEVLPFVEQEETGVELEALMRGLRSLFESYVRLNTKRLPPDTVAAVNRIEAPAKLADTVA